MDDAIVRLAPSTDREAACSATETVAVVGHSDGFDSLAEEWRRLHDDNGLSVFQSFEWQRTWWRHFGQNDRRCRLYILLVRRDQQLIGIAPLYIFTESVLGIWRVRKLQFVGHKDSDYLDVLVAKGSETPVAHRLAGHLANHWREFDVVLLPDMPERWGRAALLYDALAQTGLSGSMYINEYCPRVALRDTWEATLEQFSSIRRRQIGKRRRKISQNYAAAVDVTTSSANVSADIDAMIQLHQQRWNSKGHQGVFADSRTIAFHQEVAGRLFARGWLHLAFLRLDGNRSAVFYGFRHRDELACYTAGVAADCCAAQYSPGNVLHSYVMEAAIQHGLQAYDFMRGREPYKYTFGATDYANWTVRMYASRYSIARLTFPLHQFAVKLRDRLGREVHLYRQRAAADGSDPLRMTRYIGSRLRWNAADLAQRSKALWRKAAKVARFARRNRTRDTN